ncbi:FOXM1 protein, partial [Turnix velox]|nr:FOXM1 protein [Turnix velox]
MRTSPRRPLILKRRKLTLSQKDSCSTSAKDEKSSKDEKTPKQEHSQEDQHNRQGEKIECGLQKFPAGIKIIDHPTMPNTQVVAIPTNADIQSIIEALTAKGKEYGNNGPNKFILISSGGTSHSGSAGPMPSQHLPLHKKPTTATKSADAQEREKNATQTPGLAEETALLHSGSYWVIIPTGNGETTNSVLDNSLTNIQWLGKMRSDGLSPCSVKQDKEKENRRPLQERIKVNSAAAAIPAAAATSSSWQDSVSERPPYSYMAMIQFAINSTEKKRMTLKDIYTWIEDHFPYFKNVAKPGWKNSIRHNLSLHDMFVRETSANGKISFWTIHPDANRCLTLDQVFKPLDLGSPTSPKHSESQQKRHIPDHQKNMGSNSKTEPQNARRKMKPLLPRINSYLVPIQFPLSQPLVLQPSVKVPVPMGQAASLNNSEIFRSNKRVCIAPKMSLTAEESSSLPMAVVKEESQCDEGLFPPTHSIKDSSTQTVEESVSFPESVCIKEEEGSQLDDWLSPFASTLTVKEEPGLLFSVSSSEKKQFTIVKSPPKGVSDTLVIKRRQRREMGRSRRKQRLALPCSEEPVLVLPENNDFDSLRLGTDHSFLQECQPSENVSQLSSLQGEEGPFKTPVKMFSKLPVSSTPSKVSATTAPPLGGLDQWKSAPLDKGSHELDFSPVRTIQLPFTPVQENQDLLSFSSTPLKNPLFESPRELLNTECTDIVHAPLTSSPAFVSESSKQLSVELPTFGFTENRSLMEGLILDTMNDSLSKIFLDVSFPGLEDENLGADISWSQLIPELK